MRYRMIGIDLDGTLLDGLGLPGEPELEAIRGAVDAGVRVVPCTGRGWQESRRVLEHVPGIDLGVFVCGAAVVDVTSGNPVDAVMLDPRVAAALVECLRDEPDAVLVFREATETGHDYLVTGGQMTPTTREWFELTGARVHEQSHVSVDDLRHTLRVGMIVTGDRLPGTMRKVEQALGNRVLMHSIAAVQKPDPRRSVHVLEVFAPGVDKWRGLTWAARHYGIEPGEVATIGDEINDVPMLLGAGCGIAMGNAVESAKAAADRVTLSNREHGVAHAIEQMLAGKW